MDYGSRRRAIARGSRKRRRPILARITAVGLASVGVVTALAAVGWWLLAGNDGQASATPAPQSAETAVVAAAPTAHPRQRIGALAEGSAALPPAAATPPIAELRVNGGSRFVKPVAAFAQVDDWYGTPRQYGTIHSGVDFGLEGMGSVQVSAPCAGKVLEAATDERYGPHVVIDCDGGWLAVVAYLGRVDATAGQTVASGAQVGASDTVDEFVHFEIDWQGAPVDPADYVELPPRPHSPATPTPSPVIRLAGAGPNRGAPANNETATPMATATQTTASETPAASSPSPRPPSTPTATATRTPQPTATPTPKGSSAAPTQIPVAR